MTRTHKNWNHKNTRNTCMQQPLACFQKMYTQCRLRGCVRLDRGGGGVCVGWLPKCFQIYKKFSGHIIIFQNYLNFPENLLQIYLNLPKSALEIYLKFLMSNYQGYCTILNLTNQCSLFMIVRHIFEISEDDHPLKIVVRWSRPR